ncbi:D-alanyl-D-alanine carboxypeptidase [Tenacibaculum sp. 190524A05c]
MNLSRILRFLFLFVLFSFFASCSKKQTLDELLLEMETNKEAMGTISIFKQGAEIYNSSFGYKKMESKERANENTRYWIGSISKTYTATIILQLIDEGKISFNRKLGEFFPGIVNAKEITIKDLLLHRSGLHNVTNDPSFEVWIAEPRSRKEMIARIKKFKPVFKPNKMTEYSNTNYVLLSYIAEKIEDKSFEEILERRIFKRLNLKRTSFNDTLNLANNEAMDYFPENGDWSPITYQTNLTGTMGAGGIISTAREVNIFYNDLFSGEFLSDQTLKTMTTPVGDDLGMGIAVSTMKGSDIYGHTGRIDGFRSMAAYFPEEKLSIALTFNCGKGSMVKKMKRVLNAYRYTFK